MKSPRLSSPQEARVSDKVTPKLSSSSPTIGSGIRLSHTPPVAPGSGLAFYQNDSLSASGGRDKPDGMVHSPSMGAGAMGQISFASGHSFASPVLQPMAGPPLGISPSAGHPYVMDRSSQGISSGPALTRSFVFGLPSSISSPFQFTPASTLQPSTAPVNVGSASVTASPFQFSASMPQSLRSQPPSTAGSFGQGIPSLGGLQPGIGSGLGGQNISALPQFNIFGTSTSAITTCSSIKPLPSSTAATVSPAKSPILSSLGKSVPFTSAGSPLQPGASTSSVAPVLSFLSTGVFGGLPPFSSPSTVGPSPQSGPQLGGPPHPSVSTSPFTVLLSGSPAQPLVATSSARPLASATSARKVSPQPDVIIPPYVSTSMVPTLGVSTNTVAPLPSFLSKSTASPSQPQAGATTSTFNPKSFIESTLAAGPLPSFGPDSPFQSGSSGSKRPFGVSTNTVSPLPSVASKTTVGLFQPGASTSTLGSLPFGVSTTTTSTLPSKTTLGPFQPGASTSTLGSSLPFNFGVSTTTALPSKSSVSLSQPGASASTFNPMPFGVSTSTTGPGPSFVFKSPLGPFKPGASTSTLSSGPPTTTVSALPSVTTKSSASPFQPGVSAGTLNPVSTSPFAPLPSFASTSTVSQLPPFAPTSFVTAPTTTSVTTFTKPLLTSGSGTSTFQFGTPFAFSTSKPVSAQPPSQGGLALGASSEVSTPQPPGTKMFKLTPQSDAISKQTDIPVLGVAQPSQSQSGVTLGDASTQPLFSSPSPFKFPRMSDTSVAPTESSVSASVTLTSLPKTQAQTPFVFQKSTSEQKVEESRSAEFSPMLASLLSTTRTVTSTSVRSPVPSLPLTVHSTPKNEADTADDSFTVSSPHFEPLVSLPLVDEIKSGEEDEEVLFSHRAKLYRFHTNQWKERGLGDMKILKHKTTGKIRLLMRRDQVLKLCCNHYITATMSLTELKGLTQLAWCTNGDYAEGVPKPEKFTVKFKHEDTGRHFKEVFEECVRDLSQEQSLSLSDNVADVSGSSNPDDSISSQKNYAPPLSLLSLPSVKKGWTCDTCLVINEPSHVKCIACGTANADKKALTQGWVCSTCYVRNTDSSVQCVACESARPVQGEPASLSSAATSGNKWTCSACLVQNKATDLHCVSCQTPKSAQTKPSSRDTLEGNLPPGSWQCSSCSATNFPSMNVCIKCSSPQGAKAESKDVGAAPISIPTSFKFGQQLPSSSGPFSGFKLGSTLLKASGIQTELPKSDHSGIKIPGLSLPASKPLDVSVPESIKTMVGEDHDNSLEREPDVYFTPVVSLPERVDVKTGEETEEILFSDRAKLFKFDSKTSSWKERGIGNIKILKNKASGKNRLLMRREQVLKICCNHYITSETTLIAMQSSTKSWSWYTSCDFSDEEGKPEKFAIRFKQQDSADKFKKTVDRCVSECDDDQPAEGSIEQEESAEEGHSSDDQDSEEPLTQATKQPAKTAEVIDRPAQPAGITKQPAELAGVTSQHTAPALTPHQPAGMSPVTEQQRELTGEVDRDIIFVKDEMPSKDKVELARKFMLPDSFFNYETKSPCPGCRGCIDQIDGRYSPSEGQTSRTPPNVVEPFKSTEEKVKPFASHVH